MNCLELLAGATAVRRPRFAFEALVGVNPLLRSFGLDSTWRMAPPEMGIIDQQPSSLSLLRRASGELIPLILSISVATPRGSLLTKCRLQVFRQRSPSTHSVGAKSGAEQCAKHTLPLSPMPSSAEDHHCRRDASSCHHAIGPKREMPGVRGRRPRGGLVKRLRWRGSFRLAGADAGRRNRRARRASQPWDDPFRRPRRRCLSQRRKERQGDRGLSSSLPLHSWRLGERRIQSVYFRVHFTFIDAV